MKTLAFKSTSIVSIIFFVSTSAWAEFNTARTLGFAGVGSVNAESSGAAFIHNPASFSLNANLEMGLGYGRGDRSVGPSEVDERSYYAWATDSISSSFRTKKNNNVVKAVDGAQSFPFTASVLFHDYKTDLGNHKLYQLSISRVVSSKLSVGVSGKHFDGEEAGIGLSKWSSDMGLVYRSSKKVHWGLSWLNFNSNDNLQERLRGGVAYHVYNMASLFFDVDHSLEEGADEWAYGGGFEARMREFFVFRSGYFAREGDLSDFLGLGLSFVGPRLQMHYGVKIDMDSKAALHSVDFSLPLW